MSGIARNTLRLKSLVMPAKLAGNPVQQTSRNLWLAVASNSSAPCSSRFMQQRTSNNCYSSGFAADAMLLTKNHATSARIAPNCCSYSTTAEKELVEFLAEEIVAEKKALKLKTIPTELEGFKVSLDGADVTLRKSQGEEQITISFNINHTVDLEEEPEIDPRDDNPNTGDMKSKPDFDVRIEKGDQTLMFSCSFNDQPGASGESDEYNDIFGINEIALYKGEYSNKVYSIAGEIIDGYLYDLLMNYLEEKGVSNEFAEQLIDLSTSYEQTSYIGLLEGLSNFTKK